MSYQSPIDIIAHDMQMKTEDEICKAVQKVGVYVDKDELIRALQYDRKQYEKGYADRDNEITRCKDCIYWQRIKLSYGIVRNGTCTNHRQSVCTTKEDWFCADGRERKVSE